MNSDYAVAPEGCLGAWYALAQQNLVFFFIILQQGFGWWDKERDKQK